jgi:hypothetical protein
MMENMNDELPKIGYLFYYPQLDHETDRFRLDVFVSAIPTEKHFDVKHANFSVKDEKHDMEVMTIRHPWNFDKSAHVCAGLVVLEDRFGKKQEAFTFGGELTIESKEQQTVCTLVSNAPILDISAASPLNKLFIEEVEIILAKQRAAFAKPQEFEDKLCRADPFSLYLACINELETHLDAFPYKDEAHLSLPGYLQAQVKRLEAAGLLTGPAKKLEKIFK